MDSLTQMTLGAAVGAAVMGKRYGRKAAVIGAICGTIPDMDVFIPMGSPVADMTYHRGLSHSLVFCVFATPFLVWLFSKIKWFHMAQDNQTHIGVFLVLLTHILLDAMTIYGTQIFWPLPFSPVGGGSIFIIDPLYTLPFLGFLIWFLINKSQRVILYGLMISTSYLVWSVGVQNYIHHMASTQVGSDKILVQPTPFNTILWRVLVMEEGRYLVGYYSLFDDTNEIEFQSFANKTSMLPDNWATNRLKWFTKGFYGVRKEGNSTVMSDLRMGLEPDDYVFQFVVNRQPNERFQKPRNMSRISSIWERMFRDASWNKSTQTD